MEYDLDDSEAGKPLLNAEDLLEVLRYHWATDMNVFPYEQQMVQLATFLSAATFTGSRPAALHAIEYQDIELFVLKCPKIGQDSLVMKLTLRKTKSRSKRKRP